MQPTTNPWTATIERLNLCRRPTRRGTKAGTRRFKTITRVASRLCQEVSHVGKQTGVNNANLFQLTSRAIGDGTSMVRSSPDLRASFVLINARSIRNKALLLLDYIDEHGLDVVAMTETWLGDDDPSVVSELCRDDFCFAHQSRGDARRGGGVGVLFRKTLKLVSRADIETHASETCRVILRHTRFACTLRVIVVYRPPSSDFRQFLEDMGKVLLTAAAHPTETVVCGDFNTRYGDPTCTNATNLADLLDTSGFVQHVKSPTHEHGNTLDLVITSGTSQIIAAAVKPTTLVTDHYVVECELHQPKPKCLKRHIEYRKYAAIDNGQFAADLEASDIHAPELDPTALLARYDSCLRILVDDHYYYYYAPIVSMTITVRPMTPWFTSELSVEKRDLRRAERVWRQSGLTVHRQIYTGRRNNFGTSLKKARSEHYLSEIKKTRRQHAFDLQDIECTSRPRRGQAASRRVRYNPR